MIHFRSPSQNSPLLPSLFYLAVWIFNNIVILWGTRYFSMNYYGTLMILAVVISGLFWIGGIFCLVSTVSYLFTKKVKQFFIAIVLFAVTSTVLFYIDLKLAPYKLETTIGNISKVAAKASEDPETGKQMRYFDRGGPQKICYGPANTEALQKCRVCSCTEATQLVLIGEEPRCYFFEVDNGAMRSKDFVAAPCSSVSFDKDDHLIPNVLSDNKTRIFSEYIYRNNVLETCNEYRTWTDWDLKNAKIQCEYGKKIQCIIKDSSPCSVQTGRSICEKSPEKPNQVYRRIEYANGGNVSAFDYKTQCKSLLLNR